jgi:hypothetical protein
MINARSSSGIAHGPEERNPERFEAGSSSRRARDPAIHPALVPDIDDGMRSSRIPRWTREEVRSI